jgi:hypothetical protein
VAGPSASLPFFGARRGSGCIGAYWLVGPYAWTCSDAASLSPEESRPPIGAAAAGPAPEAGDGLARRYFFVGGEGTSAYASLDSAEEGTSDQELERGWTVAVVEQRELSGVTWAKTSKGLWVRLSDLVPARPSRFHGERLESGRLDLAWVTRDRAGVWGTGAPAGKPSRSLGRFDLVHVRGEEVVRAGAEAMVRIGDHEWLLARDLARPTPAAPPAEVTRPGERWIDVDLATQTLVAYEGSQPVYATLVSTGRGGADSDRATPEGVHRIWVKLLFSDMDNADRDDGDARYSMQDVPYVQFFDRGVALHGTYWHGDFGRVRSHGCVNLAPLDARWLFGFTEPRLVSGWTAVYAMGPDEGQLDEGTVVRVRGRI